MNLQSGAFLSRKSVISTGNAIISLLHGRQSVLTHNIQCSWEKLDSKFFTKYLHNDVINKNCLTDKKTSLFSLTPSTIFAHSHFSQQPVYEQATFDTRTQAEKVPMFCIYQQ